MAYLSFGSNTHTTFSDHKAFHALTREDDGLLKYTRVYLASDESVQVADGSAFAYGGLEHLEENKLNNGDPVNESVRATAEVPTESWQFDKRARQYEQSRFDDNRLSYYINEDGWLVARYLADYPYDNKDGALRNWKA